MVGTAKGSGGGGWALFDPDPQPATATSSATDDDAAAVVPVAVLWWWGVQAVTAAHSRNPADSRQPSGTSPRVVVGPHKNSFERRQSVFDTKGNLITSWKPTEGQMETSGVLCWDSATHSTALHA